LYKTVYVFQMPFCNSSKQRFFYPEEARNIFFRSGSNYL